MDEVNTQTINALSVIAQTDNAHIELSQRRKKALRKILHQQKKVGSKILSTNYRLDRVRDQIHYANTVKDSTMRELLEKKSAMLQERVDSLENKFYRLDRREDKLKHIISRERDRFIPARISRLAKFFSQSAKETRPHKVRHQTMNSLVSNR